jgi:cell wall-associated NlpC family hydrolase
MREAPEFRDLIGKSFAYGGRGPDTYDCYGLLLEMNRRMGVEIPDYFSPDDTLKIALIIESEKRLWTPVNAPNTGVAVALRVGRHVAHVGFMIDRTNMLHAWKQSGGVMYEPLPGSVWERKAAGFYRFAQ